MKVFLYYIGKAKDPHANAMAADFIGRTAKFVSTEMREIHPERFDIFGKHAAARKVFLDPAGKIVSSADFAMLFSRAAMEGRDVVFLIGGHDGLPAGWRQRADQLVSMSPMTFPHELARVMLAEQIYRALCSLNHHPYVR